MDRSRLADVPIRLNKRRPRRLVLEVLSQQRDGHLYDPVVVTHVKTCRLKIQYRISPHRPVLCMPGPDPITDSELGGRSVGIR